MKKMAGLKVSMAALLLAIMLVVPIKGYAGWIPYDNFNSGEIDYSLLWGPYGDWSGVDADRYIEQGKLKIILRPGPAESRYGLAFKQHIQEIKAIRAEVTITDCTGDCRARIKTDWPLDDSAYSYQQGLNIYGSEERINGYLNLYLTEAPAPPGDPWWSWYTGLEFNPPGNIINETFVVTVWFTDDEAKFSVSEHGSIEYAHKEGFTSSAGRSYSIGVKSWDGYGTCTVYYDDIEVFIRD
jgi:hypothetical protein